MDSLLGEKDKHEANLAKHYSEHYVENTVNLHSLLHDLNASKKTQYHDDNYIKIDDPSLVALIIESYADAHKRKILEKTSDTSKTLMEMLHICKLPQTSAYRKIMSLIQQGLLIPDGFTFSHGRKVIKYKSFFDRVGIDIFRNSVTVTVQLSTK